ncbi:MAG: aminotransferase class I/II-fold pyridoxal phosphate-dependent enzyme, partial [Lachnospiraceae bacterium]|nr:aminotransferase class I/II-fold pyridoxal phosphate-dependent enzyme [Lachnospiraceae bacterium]
LANDAIILYDSAYECFITDKTLPRSIFAIEGAQKCAIEFCSLSKTAGFTGTRCGYTIVPKDLKFTASNGTEMSLNAMWNRRQTTKFNGVSYIVQKGAAEVFSKEGMAQCRANIAYYQENARIIADCMEKNNIRYFGGINSPYVWFECPMGMESWEFFDYMLNNIQVVGTPGAGFGDNGKYFFRLTAFGTKENTIEAMERFDKMLQK